MRQRINADFFTKSNATYGTFQIKLIEGEKHFLNAKFTVDGSSSDMKEFFPQLKILQEKADFDFCDLKQS